MEERKLKIGEKRVKMSGRNERGDIIKAFDSLNFINFTFKIVVFNKGSEGQKSIQSELYKINIVIQFNY